MPEKISILISDDHEVVRECLSLALSAEKDFVVDTAANKAKTLERISEKDYDVILLDLNMPDMNQFQGLIEVVEKADKSHVALFTGSEGGDIAKRALDCGAAGFFPKTMSVKLLPSAIRLVAAGGIYMPIVSWENYSEQQKATGLSEREIGVSRHLFAGLANKEIAREIGLSEVTVKMIVRSICMKLGAKNRTQAAIVAHQKGLI